MTPSRSGSASLLTNPALQRSESSRRLLPAKEQAQRAIKHAAPCWRCTAACRDQYGVDATVFHGKRAELALACSTSSGFVVASCCAL